jgi:hypothetical protein
MTEIEHVTLTLYLQECKGPFHDGRYFLRPGGTEPCCPACEEKRLKA